METKTKIAKHVYLSSVTVSDIQAAKHLFVDLLGLEIKNYSEEYQWMELGGLDQDSRIGVGQSSEGPNAEYIKAGSNATISIEVFDIERAKKHLEDHGVKFINEIIEIPNEVKLALFKDLDGNRYFLSQRL